MEYELMFLVAESKKPDLPQIIGEVKKIVENAGGTWIGEGIEFERKLAYEIKHNWRGIYFVQRFTLPDNDERDKNETKDVIATITRQMNLNKNILRYIIVNAQGLPPLEHFAKQCVKAEKTHQTTLKEKGEKIDEKLEEALNI